MRVLETKNKMIEATPFQLFTHDERLQDYHEEMVVWSREHLKTEALFYAFQVKERMETDYLPDACVNLLFSVDRKEVKGYFMGIATQTCKLTFEPDTCYFGIKPYTNVGLRCFDNDQSCLIDQVYPISEQFAHTENLFSKLYDTQTVHDRKKLLLASHRDLFLNENQRSVLAEYLSVLLCTETTAFSMEKICRETGYSQRYTQRLFRKEIGITPKLYSRIIRFQNAIKAIYADNELTLAKVAHQLGYYDQAHLIHEFQFFTHLSPTRLLQTIVTSKELVV
ncbi:helix-turn-helix domain-containing protein [Candidatus Enterococcus ferrettii]|uniref:HTH araC/xylS-type domain-containing protein n=1 Tax=Candidatus Enterococcus ferrettii TaxID=2815324 RepID=A0ABV0ET85_9ENTE|nr:helix-turn-helix domain-containing protein [Enterococcus sp. 665A]MBO1341111.1 AraC family transcriptional regulator [Enterococcus sp. 665A]